VFAFNWRAMKSTGLAAFVLILSGKSFWGQAASGHATMLEHYIGLDPSFLLYSWINLSSKYFGTI
jgi:hypothetical protein